MSLFAKVDANSYARKHLHTPRFAWTLIERYYRLDRVRSSRFDDIHASIPPAGTWGRENEKEDMKAYHSVFGKLSSPPLDGQKTTAIFKNKSFANQKTRKESMQT